MLLLTDDQEKIVSLAVPIQRRNAILGALLLSTRPGEIDEIIASERSAMAMLVLLALAASVLASMLLARTIAGPMRYPAPRFRQSPGRGGTALYRRS
jgi:two-component system sensor histidine kinase ChvG